MHKAAIIGAGNLGRRHMESLLKVALPLGLTVIDPSSASLDAAKQMAGSSPNVILNQSMDALPDTLDFVVVATNSMPRRAVVESLLSRVKVRYLLLEKVLFPRISDYGEVARLLEACGTQAWVNCGRRMFPFYQDLKTRLDGEPLYASISGGAWGMACNAIHMLDLIAYLSGGSSSPSVDASRLDEGFIPSKREGYVEFTGLLTGTLSERSSFAMQCARGNAVPMTLSLQSPSLIATIHEHAKEAVIATKDNNWVLERNAFDVPFQSQLTGLLFEELMSTGTCALTPYDESTKLHLPMLGAFLEHYSKATGREETICPIT